MTQKAMAKQVSKMHPSNGKNRPMREPRLPGSASGRLTSFSQLVNCQSSVALRDLGRVHCLPPSSEVSCEYPVADRRLTLIRNALSIRECQAQQDEPPSCLLRPESLLVLITSVRFHIIDFPQGSNMRQSRITSFSV